MKKHEGLGTWFRIWTWILGFSVCVVGGISPGAQDLIRGGSFEEGWTLSWEAEPAGGYPLVMEQEGATARTGNGFARLGMTPRAVDTLEQFLGARVSGPSSVTLSLFVRRGGKGALAPSGLRVSLIESGSALELPVVTAKPSGPGWERVAVRFSPEEMGLKTGEDYWLRLAVEGVPGASGAFLDVDDVSLTTSGGTMVLPVEPPDTLPDEEGDVPQQNSVGLSFVTMAPNRDFPNTCNCGQGAHREVKITVRGFTQAEWDSVKVKFKIPTSAKLASGANLVRESYDAASKTGVLRCTVPDAPGDKNYLGSASIKIKASDGKKVWSPPYDCIWNVNSWIESGFYYGFPDPIGNVQLQSTTQPSILGGDFFSVQAPGLGLFRKWRKNLSACGTRPGEDYVRPFIFSVEASAIPLNNNDNPPEFNEKVRVRRGDLWATTCGVPLSSTWTGDGAPSVCVGGAQNTPCIQIRDGASAKAISLVLLNPDNILNESGGNWRTFTWHYMKYAGIQEDILQFQPPPSLPALAPGSEYGPANSVGYVLDAQGNPMDIAIRPLNGASNHMVFHGTSLFRMANVTYHDWGSRNWAKDGRKGPTWDSGDSAQWGLRFEAWAPAHAPMNPVFPYLATKDDPNPDLCARQGVPFEVVPSFAADVASTDCLKRGLDCPKSWPAETWEQSQTLETFWVGPDEYSRLHASIENCGPLEECDDFVVTPSLINGGTDEAGRTRVRFVLSYQWTGTTTPESVNFTAKVTLDGYGVVESRNINLYRP